MSDYKLPLSYGVLSGFLLGVLMMELLADNDYQQQAIERGYGLHCPSTGDYAWKGECDE